MFSARFCWQRPRRRPHQAIVLRIGEHEKPDHTYVGMRRLDQARGFDAVQVR